MSRASGFLSSASCLRKARVPECAIVPRFSTSSAWVIPTPVSAIVIVPAFSSVVTEMAGGTSGCALCVPDDWRNRRRSHASAALEMSSRTKMSRSVYREWITMSSSCSISAWK